ncbi:MAG: hypothetical protein K0R73_1344 [Candidatus Midichloriaceae bacterium]|jgi:cell pole-organizing protein PopZ|nr:hypothetical protein [Candidatus Midichloriaceae bacterium]
MSNTSNKIDVAVSPDGNIDQILSDIKQAITNPSSQEDVLILTEQVEPGIYSNLANDSITENCPPAEKNLQPAASQEQDILKQLDEDVLKAGAKYEPIQDKSFEQMSTTSLIKEEVAAATKNAISEMLRSATSSGESKNAQNSVLASKSLEDVVITLLRAELQNWLNENLEGMVKTIVENEIKRIIPK